MKPLLHQNVPDAGSNLVPVGKAVWQT